MAVTAANYWQVVKLKKDKTLTIHAAYTAINPDKHFIQIKEDTQN